MTNKDYSRRLLDGLKEAEAAGKWLANNVANLSYGDLVAATKAVTKLEISALVALAKLRQQRNA
jgi:hypothetical protein